MNLFSLGLRELFYPKPIGDTVTTYKSLQLLIGLGIKMAVISRGMSVYTFLKAILALMS